MKDSAAHSIIYKITPEVIGLEGMVRSTAMFGNAFYVAFLNYDLERAKEIRKVLRWNPQNGQWTTLLTEILTDKYPEQRVLHPKAADGSLLNVADILLSPSLADEGKIEFEFFSPCGRKRWKLAADGKSLKESENPAKNAKVLASKKLGDVIYGILLDAEGKRTLGKLTSSGWETLAAPAGGVLSQLIVFQDQLYVAANDARRGFSLSKLVAGEAEPSWQPILAEGALRFILNADVMSTGVHEGDLYFTAGVTDPEKIRRHDRYYFSGGFELLTVHPDGDWDIIIGTLRPSNEGLKIPIGQPLEEFENLLSPQAKAFVACDGRLLLCVESELGYHAYESFDGLVWEKVWPDAFGAYESVQFASTHATDAGPILEMETADYEKRGFLEFWLATAHATEVAAAPADDAPKKKKRAPRNAAKKAE